MTTMSTPSQLKQEKDSSKEPKQKRLIKCLALENGTIGKGDTLQRVKADTEFMVEEGIVGSWFIPVDPNEKPCDLPPKKAERRRIAALRLQDAKEKAGKASDDPQSMRSMIGGA